MAMCEAFRAPVQTPPIESVVLTLTADEAYALATVLAHIEGSHTASPRLLTDSIGYVLRDAGVLYELSRYDDLIAAGRDRLEFLSEV